MSTTDIVEYVQRVRLLLDDAPILCDWDSMDLRPLGEHNDDAKDPPSGQLMEEEMDDSTLYNVSDFVVIKSNKDITPLQRFWIGQIVGVTTCDEMPDIDAMDPDPDIDSKTRWLKIWWYESAKEYGKYTAGWQHVQGQRQRMMSWEEQEILICKLAKSLNADGTIKNYPKYRARLEYDIKRAWDELAPQEDMKYELIRDSCTAEMAQALRGQRVSRYDEDDDENIAGMIINIIFPNDDNNDRRIYFTVMYDGGTTQQYTHEEILKLLS
jgi:hypothetical protein